MTPPPWLTVRRGDAPLILSFPHTGTTLTPDCMSDLASAELALHDTDWFIDRLYAFSEALGATTIHTALSRTVVDVNRDPSGASLYPGQATTGLVPVETFDGRPLYVVGRQPERAEIDRRRRAYFAPYHDALGAEILRLRAQHARVVLYDCHSIRSVIPRLFAGELPVFNIGTNGGASCDAGLAETVRRLCAASGHPTVVDGRFKGGWITRHYGQPARGVHALQMELAIRGYLPNEAKPYWDADFAKPLQAVLHDVLTACLDFATSRASAWTLSP